MPSKDRTIELLRAQVKERRENFLRAFHPYPKQRDFVDATLDHNECALIAGNQTGKSTIGSVLMACHLTGIYPDWFSGRKFDRPIRAWACGESTVAVRDVAQKKLLGEPGNEAAWGTGAIPKASLVGKILGHGAGGAIDTVHVKHVSGGISSLVFKSYDQERSKWQGDTVDVIWMDEEPDLDHYIEALARTAASKGLIYSTFTPLSGLLNIVPRFREGSPDRALIRMTLDDCPHFADPKARDALLSMYPQHERRARLEGLPALGSGAVFEGVELANLIESLSLQGAEVFHADHGAIQTGHWYWLWAIDFGIDHPFAAVLLAWDKDYDCVYLLAELKIKGGIPAIHASRMRAIAANVPVAWPHDGNQRDKGSGKSLASIYKGEGLAMLPTHAQFATGGYSTEAGIMEMLTRMRDGRFKIGSATNEWREEFEGYHRKNGLIVKSNDDLLSATRIGLMQIRSAKQGRLGGTRRTRPIGGLMARDVDFDVFA